MKCSIAGINYSIAITIKFRQRMKAICRFLTIFQNGVFTKQLSPIIDLPITVFI